MTPQQLQDSYLVARQREDAHIARRDGRYHARQRATFDLGDRVRADAFAIDLPNGSRVTFADLVTRKDDER